MGNTSEATARPSAVPTFPQPDPKLRPFKFVIVALVLDESDTEYTLGKGPEEVSGGLAGLQAWVDAFPEKLQSAQPSD